tara:strand:- start:295 stop:597 length:303 start_codon:yes stop_codon:yes gene_type:complete
VATRLPEVITWRFAETLPRNYRVFRLGEQGKERSPRSLGPRKGAPQTSFSATSVDVVIILVLKRSEATNNNHKNKWRKKCCNATKWYINVAMQHKKINAK